MKPNFALNLSHEGISLLHRSGSGWMRVGDVALDDPDLTAQLQVLRRTAADLENGGLTSKLVIPNSQILYTEIDAPGPDTASRIAQIRDGLVGLTPYDVKDLVFDWRMRGARAHVAVVARDTLREAEDFAVEYRFNPLSFVAVPREGQFDGEPFFGPSRHAASLLQDGESIEQDDERIEIVGSTGPAGRKPARRKTRKDAPASPKNEPAQPESETGTDPQDEQTESRQDERTEPDPVPAPPSAKPETPADPPVSDPVGADESGEPVPATFSSRRSTHAATPEPAGESGSDAASTVRTETPEPVPPVADAPGPDAPSPDPIIGTRRNGAMVEDRKDAPAPDEAVPDDPIEIDLYSTPKPDPRADQARTAKPAALPPRAKVGPITRNPPAPSTTAFGATAARGPDRTPMPVTSPHTAGLDDAADKSGNRRGLAKDKARNASSALADGLGRLGRSTAESARKLRARADKRAAETADMPQSPAGTPLTAPGAPKPQPKPDAATAKPKSTEVEAMTVFGARGRSAQRGKPKYLGLVLTLLLLLALAVLALWSTYFMNDVTSGWFGKIEDDTEVSAPAVLPQPVDPEPDGATETVALPEPVVPDAGTTEETGVDTPPSPIDIAIADALNEPSPVESEPEPVVTDPDPAIDIAALPDTETDPATPDSPTEPVETTEPVEPSESDPPAETAEPVAPVVGEPDIATPEPEPPAPDPVAPEIVAPEQPEPIVPEPIITAPVRQPPPTRAEAEARYAATGIWELDPVPPADVPGGGDRVDDVYVASIDQDIGSVDAFALPDAGSLTTDVLPPALTPPPPLGTRFEFDDRGLVRATPEGAVTPDGVQVFTGRPPVVPGPRPADLDVPVDETSLRETERLRTLRPSLRPGNLSEANERARLGGLSSVELAAIRPTARPARPDTQRAALTGPARPSEETSSEVAASEDTETTRALPSPVALAVATPAPPVEDETATDLAVLASFAPTTRPSDFAGVVRRALAEARAEEEAAAAAAATPAPAGPARPAPAARPEKVVSAAAVAPPRAPSIPTTASVAKNATVRNAIPLNKVNLIGVYGSSTSRRALVRLASGRYVKVKVGDRVDGGKVASIGDNELRYVKRGRNITLKMPRG